jgi:hypothetical protein
MKKETITYLILIAFTSAVLFVLLKFTQAGRSPKTVQFDTYPYYGADTLHSEIKLGEDDIR